MKKSAFIGLLAAPLNLAQATERRPVELDKVRASMSVPANWETDLNRPGLSLVAQEPEAKEPVYSQPIYRRNLTVSVSHQGTPIDEPFAQIFRQELTERLAKGAGMQDFAIREHRFFEHKAKSQGLLVFTQFTQNKIALAQMHVVYSSAEMRYHLVYTDLAERFNAEPDFTTAWETVSSFNYIGETPVRFAWKSEHFVLIGGSVAALLALRLLLRRRRDQELQAENDAIYTDDSPNANLQVSSIAALSHWVR